MHARLTGQNKLDANLLQLVVGGFHGVELRSDPIQSTQFDHGPIEDRQRHRRGLFKLQGRVSSNIRSSIGQRNSLSFSLRTSRNLAGLSPRARQGCGYGGKGLHPHAIWDMLWNTAVVVSIEKFREHLHLFI
ncbi:hypothetical protein A0H81_09300 [Grifola frondosa]|uniref:Uncharacterized protein n=1 Tax=Grifola frondosa TaxID=5627 RepID=A0A1C7M210_GRIFR|nr:hypothetical protein A0H81_09300 [Grifola frondosa]